ncbi:hypothetical protein J2Y48_003950 [Mycoplana sp. BE70]|uniref:hypothetical protein n=1 Tax=Mycoplana sp. BE70 TaxID=2817775 RepID=UPI002862ED84|nr:hypothetical protein [Mycoplana sp. BE70]MDR6758642.1 hypothetical protein [Mycoplana sp. BE70]
MSDLHLSLPLGGRFRTGSNAALYAVDRAFDRVGETSSHDVMDRRVLVHVPFADNFEKRVLASRRYPSPPNSSVFPWNQSCQGGFGACRKKRHYPEGEQL